MQKKYSDIITSFLKDRKLISVKALEELLNIPQSTIGQAMNGSRLIPGVHIFPLLCELSRYGIEIDGYSLSLDEETGVLFGRKWIEDIKTIETDQNFERITKYSHHSWSSYFDLN